MNKIIIVAAPSGSGKSVIVEALLKLLPNLVYSVSATTRAKRDGEIDGVDYYFIKNDDFKSNIENNELIEYQEVYKDVYYGTLKSDINKKFSEGKDIIFVLDVKGALVMKKYFKDTALSIFIKAPSIDTLERRLRKRNSDTETAIRERLKKAEYEITFKDNFDFIILNDDLNLAINLCRMVIEKFRS